LPQILRNRRRRFLRRRHKAVNLLEQPFVTLTKNRFSSCQCSSPTSFSCSNALLDRPPSSILPLRPPSLASVPFETPIVAAIAGITKLMISFYFTWCFSIRHSTFFVMDSIFIFPITVFLSFVTKGTKLKSTRCSNPFFVALLLISFS